VYDTAWFRTQAEVHRQDRTNPGIQWQEKHGDDPFIYIVNISQKKSVSMFYDLNQGDRIPSIHDLNGHGNIALQS
jgi:hypothetical protein